MVSKLGEMRALAVEVVEVGEERDGPNQDD